MRARQNYLFDKYVSEHSYLTPEVRDKITKATTAYSQKNLPKAPLSSTDFATWAATVDVADESKENPKFSMHFSALKNAYAASASTGDAVDALELAKDVLILVLDEEEGSAVRDPELFRKLPAFWENHFNEDMQALNVLPPTVVTRVSEYVPEIVSFVEQMVKNGYAYEAQGSVYFDTASFEREGKHVYAKLQPWSRGKTDLIDEGEGSLSVKTTADGKKSPFDFALWKASKPGEPEWASPWGQGRPGWHIECSVMASEVIGSQMDIHSGGIDLAFPHHDNELAQSEAYHECPQWVNYFLHTGHLHIEGLKMSKSLKNFITIREALEKYSSRQLRLAFALTQWNSALDFKEGLISEVKTVETTFTNFFAVVRALVAEDSASIAAGAHIPQRFGTLEKTLFKELATAQEEVHAALCDNLATPAAIQNMVNLVARANIYVSAAKAEVSTSTLAEVARWCTRVLSVFGFDARPDGLGWSDPTDSESSSAEEIAMPFVRVLSRYRDQVRKSAIAKDPYSEFLKASDRVRNEDLLELGVALDDRDGDLPALVKFVDKEELARQRAEKLAKENAKLDRKKKAKEEEEKKARERIEKGKTDPKEMFKAMEEFSLFDETGLPTHDKEGVELAKSRKKKLAKEYETQKKLHAEYLKWLEQSK